MTTNTPDTTRLSEAHVRRMLGATAFIDPPDAAKDVKALCHAYLTLAADLARAEAERDRYREALEHLLDTAERLRDGSLLSEQWYEARDMARSALYAADAPGAGEAR